MRLAILFPLTARRAARDADAVEYAVAAEELTAHGIDVVIGTSAGRLGLRSRRWFEGEWRPLGVCRVQGVYHRYPDMAFPDRWERLRRQTRRLPMINADSIVRLCRDKLATQQFLEEHGVPLPEATGETAGFPDALRRWGAGFLKPRFGSYGRGVALLTEADALPADLEPEGWVLQRAIFPPAGTPGLSVRLLAQRREGGAWTLRTGVARVGAGDPVISHTRGAGVGPAPDLLPAGSIQLMKTLGLQACAAFDQLPQARFVAELGFDMVFDAELRPHLIEVNGKPRGRLRLLRDVEPERFDAEWRDTVSAPLRYLASIL